MSNTASYERTRAMRLRAVEEATRRGWQTHHLAVWRDWEMGSSVIVSAAVHWMDHRGDYAVLLWVIDYTMEPGDSRQYTPVGSDQYRETVADAFDLAEQIAEWYLADHRPSTTGGNDA